MGLEATWRQLLARVGEVRQPTIQQTVPHCLRQRLEQTACVQQILQIAHHVFRQYASML
jgi:hypothetical protein